MATQFVMSDFARFTNFCIKCMVVEFFKNSYFWAFWINIACYCLEVYFLYVKFKDVVLLDLYKIVDLFNFEL